MGAGSRPGDWDWLSSEGLVGGNPERLRSLQALPVNS